MIAPSRRAAKISNMMGRVVDADHSAGASRMSVSLESYWSELIDRDGVQEITALAGLVKEDLRRRYARGERPSMHDYLERFPILRDEHDRMISLVYEEFCLREELGERPDPEEFCRRYEPWRDSLMSQLCYHDAFSQLASMPNRPIRFPEPGQQFLRFQLCSELGRGGVARVYLARDPDLGGKRMALKLSPDRGDEPAIQGRLDHPHIVPVNRVERELDSGLRGLCMPYWPGLPLNEVITRIDPANSRPRHADAIWFSLGVPDPEEQEIERSGRPTWTGFPRQGTFADAVAWIGLKLAEALAHAHARGIVHRDIKPANILLTRRGGPMLLDFNLAQGPSNAEEAESANRGGTLPYMAPEQLRAFLDPECWDDVRPTADLFSLGLVLRELLTGEPPPTPAPGLSTPRAVRELLDRRLAGPLPPTRKANPVVPRALDAVITKCLAADPAERYADATALATDLGRFLERRPLRHTSNPSRLEQVRFWIGRNRTALFSSMLGVSLVVTLVGWFVSSRRTATIPASTPPAVAVPIDPTSTAFVATLDQTQLQSTKKEWSQSGQISKFSPDQLVEFGKIWASKPGLSRDASLFFERAFLDDPDLLDRLSPGDAEIVAEIFSRTDRLASYSVKALADLGKQAFERNFQLEDATLYYRIALKQDPTNVGILNNLAYVLRELKQYPQSLERYDAALVAARTSALRARLLIERAKLLKDWASQLQVAAAEDYDSVREVHRGRSRALALQADERYLEASKNLEEARELQSGELQADSEFLESMIYLGRASISSLNHNYAMSVTYFEAARARALHAQASLEDEQKKAEMQILLNDVEKALVKDRNRLHSLQDTRSEPGRESRDAD